MRDTREQGLQGELVERGVNWALEPAEDYAGALEVTSAVIEAARRSGSVNAFANASYYRGECRHREGRLLDALLGRHRSQTLTLGLRVAAPGRRQFEIDRRVTIVR